MKTGTGSVLVVDDEELVLDAVARVVGRAGFAVETAPSGRHALDLLANGTFDAVVSDISMPDIDGVQLVRAVRERDRDLPVLLMTGRPTVESAAKAIDYGVMKYLVKPVDMEELMSAVRRAVQLSRFGRIKREALAALGTIAGEASDRVGLETSFERALATLWMAFQPIVSAPDRNVFAYEALMRSEEPSLPHPGAVIDAAERLGQLQRLARSTRDLAARAMASQSPTWLLFVNLHPEDLLDEALLAGDEASSEIAERVVLEITERASLDRVPDLRDRVGRLRRSGYRIAVDDLGAGYAGLSSFVQLEPDFVKLDMSLVREVHRSSMKRKLVTSLASLCQDMGLHVIAEGVETPEERDALVELGVGLQQGYHFARPSRPFVQPRW